LRFIVSSAGSSQVTEIGPHADSLALSEARVQRLRVALLGCGTVGAGVYQRLAAQPEVFDVVGVGTRSVERAVQSGVPAKVLTTHLEALIAEPVDVVIELLGGQEPAGTLIARALRVGRHVVTANKSLLASEVAPLERLAAGSGVALKYNAAVGGVLPALETVSRARRFGALHSIAGVLNGTTNFILDQLANGSDFASAVSAAQMNGYAERDPQFDLNGTDAAQKLILLARAAFDVDLPLSSVKKQGIQNVKPNRNNGHITRLVAVCQREAHGFTASVSPVELPLEHPLASVNGVENRLLIQSQTGKSWDVCGSGAGRWPTTEAVMADVFDLWRESCAVEEGQECVA